MAILGLKTQICLWLKLLPSKPDIKNSTQLARSKNSSFLQVGFLPYGSSYGLYLDLCKRLAVHYLLIQLVKKTKMAASPEPEILFTLTQDSQGAGLRESHFRGQRFQARQFQVSGFCFNRLTLGTNVYMGHQSRRFSLPTSGQKQQEKHPFPGHNQKWKLPREAVKVLFSKPKENDDFPVLRENTELFTVCVAKSPPHPFWPMFPSSCFSSSCSFFIQAPIKALTLRILGVSTSKSLTIENNSYVEYAFLNQSHFSHLLGLLKEALLF